jgi:hypothetical protein
MKLVYGLLSACLVLISAVIIYLVIDGTALRSAGVIKPTVYESDNKLLAKSVALRLFPEFQSSQHTVWLATGDLQDQSRAIVESIHDYYKSLNTPTIPELYFLNSGDAESQVTNLTRPAWWVFQTESKGAINLIRQGGSEPAQIYMSYFKRDEPVPAECETEKVLTRNCLKLVAIREVKKKFRSEKPYFFMRRYNDHEFYLFIEQK